jgi:prefoldin subunit 5
MPAIMLLLVLCVLYPQATAAAEDALEAHKLLKLREDNMDAELSAANSKAEQLSAALTAAQQQAAEAQARAAEAEEQCTQVRDE